MTGKQLRALRSQLGLTQAQLADAVDVPPNTVARWERNEMEMRPAMDTLVRAAVAKLQRARREASMTETITLKPEPQQQVQVFINPMKLFEWEMEPISTLPEDPTPERLLQFLCTLGLRSDMEAFKARYRAISVKDQDFFFAIQDAGMVENLSGPLRQAKTSYLLGNYVGAIALCGLVAEKVAILMHAIKTPDEAARDAFERMEQSKRVDALKKRGLTTQSVQDFGSIRAARRDYLHYWTSIGDERMARDTVRAYGAATRLVLAAMGVSFVNGALALSPPLAAYLKARGVIRDTAGADKSGESCP